MKRILFFLIIAVLFLACVVYNNSDPKVIISELAKKGDIRQGDLKYRINLFGIIPIGEATLSLERQVDYKGSKVYHLNAVAVPLKCYAKFFKGYATLDSYVDLDTLNPVLFKQKVEAPGKENSFKEVSYDQKKGTMSLEGVQRSIFPNTQDPLSAVFNIRRMDFDNAKRIEISINTNQKNYILAGSAEISDLSVNKRVYKIAVLNTEIKRRNKDSYHKSKVLMVLLRGKENIPISIKVFASGIVINAKLIGIY